MKDIEKRITLMEDQVEKLTAKCKIQKGALMLHKVKTRQDINVLRNQEIEELKDRVRILERFIKEGNTYSKITGTEDVDMDIIAVPNEVGRNEKTNINGLNNISVGKTTMNAQVEVNGTEHGQKPVTVKSLTTAPKNSTKASFTVEENDGSRSHHHDDEDADLRKRSATTNDNDTDKLKTRVKEKSPSKRVHKKTCRTEVDGSEQGQHEDMEQDQQEDFTKTSSPGEDGGKKTKGHVAVEPSAAREDAENETIPSLAVEPAAAGENSEDKTEASLAVEPAAGGENCANKTNASLVIPVEPATAGENCANKTNASLVIPVEPAVAGENSENKGKTPMVEPSAAGENTASPVVEPCRAGKSGENKTKPSLVVTPCPAGKDVNNKIRSSRMGEPSAVVENGKNKTRASHALGLSAAAKRGQNKTQASLAVENSSSYTIGNVDKFSVSTTKGGKDLRNSGGFTKGKGTDIKISLITTTTKPSKTNSVRTKTVDNKRKEHAKAGEGEYRDKNDTSDSEASTAARENAKNKSRASLVVEESPGNRPVDNFTLPSANNMEDSENDTSSSSSDDDDSNSEKSYSSSKHQTDSSLSLVRKPRWMEEQQMQLGKTSNGGNRSRGSTPSSPRQATKRLDHPSPRVTPNAPAKKSRPGF